MKWLILLGLYGLVAACARPSYVSRDGQLSRQSVPCEKKFSNGLCVSLQWEALPVVNLDASLVIVVTQADGLLANSKMIPFVELYMPAHQHGSTDVEIKPLAKGLYHVGQMNFFMPGDWEIRVQLKEGDTVLEQLVWTYTL